MNIDAGKIETKIENFIRQMFDNFQRDGVILGVSGGVDSALVATLLTRALGPDKVLALLLPERDSSPDSKTDALKVINRLGIDYREVDIEPVLTAMGIYKLVPLNILGARKIKETVVKQQHNSQSKLLGEMPFQAGLLGTRHLGKTKQLINAGNAYARAKHRARIMTLYYYADLENRLVAGTTNKSESMTGFVVKWGDNVADIEPILPLYKTQVWQLSSYLGVEQEIIDKTPSPDLMPGIVDEIALGIDYLTLDKILFSLAQNWESGQIEAAYGVTADQVDHVKEMAQRSWHLRELPPYPELF
ncbi:NAD(+) synthase [Chloroflexota bacterium]